METAEKILKTIEIIKGIKKEIKILAEEQKCRRLQKLQKSYSASAALTVLHRLYLKIRNKPYEDVHRFNEHTKWWAQKFTEKYSELWNVSEILPD